MTNKLAIVVGAVSLVIIIALVVHGQTLKNQLKETNEDFADEKIRSKRSQRQNLDYETRIRDLEVALRQKTEDYTAAQTEIEEAQQQAQEHAGFLTEVSTALADMAMHFDIDIDAEETLATTVIRTLDTSIKQKFEELKSELAATHDRANTLNNLLKTAEEDFAAHKHEDEGRANEYQTVAKELEAMKADYKKLNTLVRAMIAEDGNTENLKQQQTVIDTKIAQVDAKIKQLTGTPAPSTQAPTPAPTKAAPVVPNEYATQNEEDTDGGQVDGDDQNETQNNGTDEEDTAEVVADEEADDTADANEEEEEAYQGTSSTGQQLNKNNEKNKGGNKKGTNTDTY